MPFYRVRIERTEYKYAETDIEAESLEEAEEIAEDLDFTDEEYETANADENRIVEKIPPGGDSVED